MTREEGLVYTALERQYGRKYIILPQVRICTGYGNYGGDRLADFYMMNPWPSANYHVMILEVKVSIRDFYSDIRSPQKQMLAHLYSDEFYYVFPEKLFEKKKEAICNLLSYKQDGIMILGENGYVYKKRKPKSKRSKIPYDFGFVASLLRKARGAS